jgi:hypothetical protein
MSANLRSACSVASPAGTIVQIARGGESFSTISSIE